jgi:hypothetical protein
MLKKVSIYNRKDLPKPKQFAVSKPESRDVIAKEPKQESKQEPLRVSRDVITKDEDDDPLVVKAFPTSKSKVKVNKAMTDHIIPKHPFRAILSGASGSGKTNLLIHLLNTKGFYKNYFDVIFIISPTAGKLDDSYNVLAKNNTKTTIRIINDLDPDSIDQIMTKNKDIILKKKVHMSPKILIVYDDVIGDRLFMNSKAFINSFIASRHYNASVFICTQKYNAIPKTPRVQANAIFFFRGTNTEREVLAIDRAPSGYSKKEMESIIDFSTTATKESPYPFLYINLQAKTQNQLRKNLDKTMTLLR